jgi:hypothetical protein
LNQLACGLALCVLPSKNGIVPSPRTMNVRVKAIEFPVEAGLLKSAAQTST